MCKSFHVSSTIIDPGYHIILLSYNSHFDSDIQTVPRKYPYRIDLPTKYNVSDDAKLKKNDVAFYPILDKNGKKTDCNIMSKS